MTIKFILKKIDNYTSLAGDYFTPCNINTLANQMAENNKSQLSDRYLIRIIKLLTMTIYPMKHRFKFSHPFKIESPFKTTLYEISTDKSPQ